MGGCPHNTFLGQACRLGQKWLFLNICHCGNFGFAAGWSHAKPCQGGGPGTILCVLLQLRQDEDAALALGYLIITQMRGSLHLRSMAYPCGGPRTLGFGGHSKDAHHHSLSFRTLCQSHPAPGQRKTEQGDQGELPESQSWGSLRTGRQWRGQTGGGDVSCST